MTKNETILRINDNVYSERMLQKNKKKANMKAFFRFNHKLMEWC